MQASFVELRLDTLRVGIPLGDVERVLRAAAVAPTPGGSPCLLGMLNLGGEPVPVYDTRRLLGLPSRALQPQDRFVLTRSGGRRAAFLADEVAGTIEVETLASPASFSAQAAGVRGVSASDETLVFIHDLKRFLFLERATRIATDA